LSRQQPPALFRYRPDTGPSLTVVLAAFVALFVLFLWLHFIVAQQIESVGRDIQVRTEELHKIERHIQDLQRQIAIAPGTEPGLPAPETRLLARRGTVAPGQDVYRGTGGSHVVFTVWLYEFIDQDKSNVGCIDQPDEFWHHWVRLTIDTEIGNENVQR